MNASLIERYIRVRERTEALAAVLSAEDQLVQAMPDCSPTKWHRAHTTWFFETFVLGALGVQPDATRANLWNSYYESIGPRVARAHRGMLSRPSVAEVAVYRREIDEQVCARLTTLASDEPTFERVRSLVELGLAHEEQHQELLLTDILNALSLNPLAPQYCPDAQARNIATGAHASEFVEYAGGLVWSGFEAGIRAFAFDNEGPRHRVWVEPFALATRLVTVGEVKAFIADGGYRTASLWLSAGWDWVRNVGIEAPLYARLDACGYHVFGLHGARTVRDDEPASHLSYYEADAIAQYLGARLPNEAEWEVAAAELEASSATSDAEFSVPNRGQFLDVQGVVESSLYPRESGALGGGVWQWTRSAYAPYPGFVPAGGAVGEYNGKFMVGQQVLRGGSCLTPRGHMRVSYRNFWPPHTRFQMTGLRLARDGGSR